VRLLGICLVLAGCSAGGVPIVEPLPEVPSVAGTANQRSAEGEFVTVATVLRDAVKLAFGSMLRVPPGDVTPETKGTVYPAKKGSLTVAGRAEVPAPDDETLLLSLTMDNYLPQLYSGVEANNVYPLDTAGLSELPLLKLVMTGLPAQPNDGFGELDGTYDGHLNVVSGPLKGDIELHLTLLSLMQTDADGKMTWLGLRVVGLMFAPAYGAYTNDIHF
jgi:hypothetical protein